MNLFVFNEMFKCWLQKEFPLKNYWWGFSPASHPAPRSLKFELMTFEILKLSTRHFDEILSCIKKQCDMI